MYTLKRRPLTLSIVLGILMILGLSAAASAKSICSHNVQGEILAKFQSLGGKNGFLGCPTTDELPTPDRIGRFNHFEGGSIYWHPDTGAHEIHGAIRDKWASLNWEKGFLGYPTTDELSAPDGVGRYNHFQGGSIHWHPDTGAHEIHGAIRDKWASLGWEKGFLGYPTTDELSTPDGVGRYNHFADGSIYWHPGLGAHEVHGAIRAHWANAGWEQGSYGYPVSDELRVGKKLRYSIFENGVIGWTRESWIFDMASKPIDNRTVSEEFQKTIDGKLQSVSAYTVNRLGSTRFVRVHHRYHGYPQVFEMRQDFDVQGHPVKLYTSFFVAPVVRNGGLCVQVVGTHTDGDIDAVLDLITFGTSEIAADKIASEVDKHLRRTFGEHGCMPVTVSNNEYIFAAIPQQNGSLQIYYCPPNKRTLCFA